MVELYKTIKRDKITLHYIGMDMINAADTLEEVIDSYDILAKQYCLYDKKLFIEVTILPSKKEYDKFLSNELGLKNEIPTKKSEVSRSYMNNIVLLSRFAYSEETTVKYSREFYYKTIQERVKEVFETFIAI